MLASISMLHTARSCRGASHTEFEEVCLAKRLGPSHLGVVSRAPSQGWRTGGHEGRARQGGLAKVAKVRWQQQEFALKFLTPVQTSDQQPPDQHQRDLEGLRREAIILVECRHDLVVSAVAWISGAVEGVVLELLGPSLSYAHSNLADQLTADKNKRRNEVLNTFQPYQLCWHLPWLIQNKRRNEVSNTFQPYQLCWHLPWLIQNKRRNEVLNTFQPYQLCWHLPWLIQNKRRNEVLNTFQPYQLCRQVPWLIQNKRRNEVLNTF